MNTFPLHEKKLSSGLRTIVLPRKDVQTVTFMVLIGVGARYETPRQAGLSHFLEHMFFKGTKNRPTTREIAEAIDNVGGDYNAFTSEEYTGFYVKVAKEHLECGADVVSDVLLNPLFPQDEIERERGVIIEEIHMYTDAPMRHVCNIWQEALFGKHPLGQRVDGREETVRSFNRPAFLRYTHGHYHTKNMVVVVAGNADVRKVQNLIGKLFSELPRGDETRPRSAPSRVPARRFAHERRDHLDQTHMMVGVPGVSRTDKQRYAAALLASILGEGMSSRLFSRVREREGLAYMVRTSLDQYVDAGSLVTQAGVRTDRADRALALILEEYDRIMDEKVGDEELEKVKQMARGGLVLQLEETNNIATFAGMQELLDSKVKVPGDIWKEVQAVTPEDIQKAAKRLLEPKRRLLALLSPHRSTVAFEKLIIKK